MAPVGRVAPTRFRKIQATKSPRGATRAGFGNSRWCSTGIPPMRKSHYPRRVRWIKSNSAVIFVGASALALLALTLVLAGYNAGGWFSGAKRMSFADRVLYLACAAFAALVGVGFLQF